VVTASGIGRNSVQLTLDPKTLDNAAGPTMYASAARCTGRTAITSSSPGGN